MRAIEWSFYDAETGIPAPACSLLPAGVDPATFAPPGCLPYAGRLDPHTQRVDPQSGRVMAVQGQAPADGGAPA